MMMKKRFGLVAGFILVLVLSSSLFAGQAIRVGYGIPTGVMGEYEYKTMLDQLGFFVNYGGMSGSTTTGGSTTDAKFTTWGLGARLYLPLGLHIKGGYTSLTADGTVVDSITSSAVDAKVVFAGIDVGLGYELGIGPVFIGLNGGLIMGQPTITSGTTNAVTGGLNDLSGLNSMPYAKLCLGFKF
jgi:hypothetical protein